MVNGPSDSAEYEMIDLFPPLVPRCWACVYSQWSQLQLLFTPRPLPPIFPSELLRVELSEQGS